MLYCIKNKYYILVSGYYKEVQVTKDGNEYNVIPVEKAKKIEASTVKDFTTVNVEKAYEKNKGTNSISSLNVQ